MVAERTERLDTAKALRTRLYSERDSRAISLRALNHAIDDVEQMGFSPNEKLRAKAWGGLATTVETATKDTTGSELVGHLRAGLEDIANESKYNVRGHIDNLRKTIRQMRGVALSTLRANPTPPIIEEAKEGKTNLLYAAELAVYRLRYIQETEGHHPPSNHEIALLTDAIRHAGGLPDGRDEDGEPV